MNSTLGMEPTTPGMKAVKIAIKQNRIIPLKCLYSQSVHSL